jgi:hypothetical protein
MDSIYKCICEVLKTLSAWRNRAHKKFLKSSEEENSISSPLSVENLQSRKDKSEGGVVE